MLVKQICPSEKRVSHHRNLTTSAIKNQHIFTKHPKAKLKDFTVIDRESNTLHHQAKEAHTSISKIHHWTETLETSGSFQYSTNISNLKLNCSNHTVPSLHPKYHFHHLVFEHKTIKIPSLISIYNVISIFIPFKLQDN